MFSADSKNLRSESIRWTQFFEVFAFSDSHNKNIYSQRLLVISELSGGENQYYQSKTRKQVERDGSIITWQWQVFGLC